MPASKAQQATTADRRNKMMALKLAGADWPTIATACGYSSRAAACRDFTRALDLSLKEESRNAEKLRHALLLTLRRLQRGLWAQSINGDTKAATVVLQIVMAEADLQGLKRLPPPEQGTEYDRRQAIREQGTALAEVTRRFLTKLGLDPMDPRAQQALRESVQEIVGIPLPTTRTVIEIEGAVVEP